MRGEERTFRFIRLVVAEASEACCLPQLRITRDEAELESTGDDVDWIGKVDRSDHSQWDAVLIELH